MRSHRNNGFFYSWEKPLFYLAIGCIILLFLSQALLLKENSRRYLSWTDKLEGESICLQTPLATGDPVTVTEHTPVTNRPAILREHKVIIVRMLKPAKSREVYVLINGSRAGDFQRGEVSLTVYEGDYLEIDASLIKEPCRFVLDIQGSGVASPQDGLLIEGNSQVIPIGKVNFLH